MKPKCFHIHENVLTKTMFSYLLFILCWKTKPLCELFCLQIVFNQKTRRFFRVILGFRLNGKCFNVLIMRIAILLSTEKCTLLTYLSSFNSFSPKLHHVIRYMRNGTPVSQRESARNVVFTFQGQFNTISSNPRLKDLLANDRLSAYRLHYTVTFSLSHFYDTHGRKGVILNSTPHGVTKWCDIIFCAKLINKLNQWTFMQTVKGLLVFQV